ncbi:MAG: hypothetical protein HQM14_09295 [SAR324 cluster bacterium]|nr:hypothetical protein [SAR324 cluster bacterium]
MKLYKDTDSVTTNASHQSKIATDPTAKVEKKDATPPTTFCVCGHSIKYPNCDGHACWGWD